MTSSRTTNILLIGKYPPLQGGIATKTYWLYNELLNHGFKYRVVTASFENYSISKKEIEQNVYCLDNTDIPWHIPNSPLFYDRLLNLCNNVISDFVPDIIETNYLWPFCSVASYLAEKLRKPLIIRHAGSDILKFHTSIVFKNIMKIYFEQASVIVTNNTCHDLVMELCSDKTKIRLMDRYVPDPEYFRDMKYPKQYDLLFAGKINYHWKLKGISHLLEHIKTNNLHALFLCDGNYLEDIYSLIGEQKLGNNIEIKKFVHPSEMPGIISKCKTVWCWDEEASIDDFSNIIWEACYCNVACLINERVEKTTTLKKLKELFPGKILEFRKEESMEYYNDEIGLSNRLNLDTLTKEFKKYIDWNISIYNSI